MVNKFFAVAEFLLPVTNSPLLGMWDPPVALAPFNWVHLYLRERGRTFDNFAGRITLKPRDMLMNTADRL
jgi:hypothetical protein